MLAKCVSDQYLESSSVYLVMRIEWSDDTDELSTKSLHPAGQCTNKGGLLIGRMIQNEAKSRWKVKEWQGLTLTVFSIPLACGLT